MASVIHVKTQEEWDIVTKFYNLKWNNNDSFNYYSVDSCINYETNTYSPINYYKGSYKIIKFKEWEIINNIKTNKQMRKEILEILEKTYKNPILRRTTIPLFMSSPGIGKTNITETFIKEYIEVNGNKMVTMVLPNLMPNEAVGGVYPNQKERIWEFYDSEKLSSLNDGDCLFLDEVFNGTLKQTLDAMLNVLGQRRLGSGKKMADVMIVAASNPQGLINLTPQIKERFIRYDLKFNSEEYQVYLKNKYGIPESISSHLCTLINKEKFEPNDWSFVTPRSVEKAINQIGCELKSNYDDVLLPYLTKTIESPMDIKKLNVKKGEQVEYLSILKLLIASNNLKLRDAEELKLKEKRIVAEKVAKEKTERQAAYEQGLVKAAAEAENLGTKLTKDTSIKNKSKKTTQVTDDSTNHKQESGVTNDLLN